MSAPLIRLHVIRGAERGDLDIELIANDLRGLRIKSQSGADNTILIEVSFRIEADTNSIQGHGDDAADNGAVSAVNGPNWNVIGFVNQCAYGQNQNFIKEVSWKNSVCGERNVNYPVQNAGVGCAFKIQDGGTNVVNHNWHGGGRRYLVIHNGSNYLEWDDRKQCWIPFELSRSHDRPL